MAKRKVKAQVTLIKEEPKSLWRKIKDFFYNSHNVAYNYVVGLLSAGVSIFAMIDWSPLMQLVQYGTGFTRNQLFWTGAIAVAVAIGGYLTRVVGTKEVDGHLLPKAD